MKQLEVPLIPNESFQSDILNEKKSKSTDNIQLDLEQSTDKRWQEPSIPIIQSIDKYLKHFEDHFSYAGHLYLATCILYASFQQNRKETLQYVQCFYFSLIVQWILNYFLIRQGEIHLKSKYNQTQLLQLTFVVALSILFMLYIQVRTLDNQYWFFWMIGFAIRLSLLLFSAQNDIKTKLFMGSIVLIAVVLSFNNFELKNMNTNYVFLSITAFLLGQSQFQNIKNIQINTLQLINLIYTQLVLFVPLLFNYPDIYAQPMTIIFEYLLLGIPCSFANYLLVKSIQKMDLQDFSMIVLIFPVVDIFIKKQLTLLLFLLTITFLALLTTRLSQLNR